MRNISLLFQCVLFSSSSSYINGFFDHSSSTLLPHVYLYIFLHFIMHSRASSLSPDLLLYIYSKLLVFSLLFLTHCTLPLSMLAGTHFCNSFIQRNPPYTSSIVLACVLRWKQPFKPISAGRISLVLSVIRLYSSDSHCTLSSKRESELVETTRTDGI